MNLSVELMCIRELVIVLARDLAANCLSFEKSVIGPRYQGYTEIGLA
jgi:hypothetical protein